MQHTDTILIVDFGSQVTQLIARRVREAGVYSEVAPFQSADEAFDRIKPAGIIATPVGFVGAEEAKGELSLDTRGVPFITLLGRRGGSAIAAAALNAIARGIKS